MLAIPRLNEPLCVAGVDRLQTVRSGQRPVVGAGVRMRVIPPVSDKAYKITGTTKDSTGVAIGNCILDLFYTGEKTKAATVESDASGNFSFSVGPNLACYIVAYKSGAPDVAGTSVNTLVGA